MPKEHQKAEKLIDQLERGIEKAKALEAKYEKELSKVHPDYRQSARNLVHYRALRSRDIRDMQRKLGNLGLSRLAQSESHVMASLRMSRNILRAMTRPEVVKFPKTKVSMKQSEKLLSSHSKALLGYRSKGRRVRIMVTLPSEASSDYQLVDELVAAGMNSARINCAHDDADAWRHMINHVRKASKKHRRKVKVCMDLAGPKIRTGRMREGPKVLSFGPTRNVLGRVVAPAVVWIAPEEVPPENLQVPHVPLPTDCLNQLAVGDELRFKDTRGKRRRLAVVEKVGDGCLANSEDRTYISTGTRVYINDQKEKTFLVGELPAVEEKILLRIGDKLVLHRNPIAGEPAIYNDDGELVQAAHLSSTCPELFDQVKAGERILFDDGKIEGVVREVVAGDHLVIEISYAKATGQKLAADKGINLPDSALTIRGLTKKDSEDLSFVVEHADVVSMSFVNTPDDVRDLRRALKKHNALDRLGIILKIETKAGFDNLTEILLSAMQAHPIGVMIARGDLAVEVGWEHMPRIQEEIMLLCMAAHVPDILATQVLENLAKKGLPSRAEVTDAAVANGAECVMLNKGPHIVQAIELLDHILKHTTVNHDRMRPVLPALELASRKVETRDNGKSSADVAVPPVAA